MTFGANRCLTIKTKTEMKKNLFMVAAVALMAMVSCNKEEINNGGVETTPEPTVIVEFEAGFEVETKTALNAEGTKTVWTLEDRISINGQEFKVSEIKEDGKAIFVNVADLPADFGAPFTAIYPYGSDGSVPAEQDAVAGNFDPKAVIETATSENHSLSFKNVTSLLKFQVPASADFSEKITSVSITSTDILAGSDAKTVTINCADGFDSDKTYYVAVLPGEKKNFEVCINGYIAKTAPKVTIARSTIADMKRLPKPVIRVYITTERTHFDMYMYAWNIEGATLPGTWPGEAMKWDNNKEKYYYDFPYEIKGKQLKFIINNNVYQTEDLNATISSATYNKAINWKWVYLLPSNNWKDGSPRFAAYFYTQNESGDYWMKSVGPDKNGVYGYVVPASKKNVIFVRLNPDNDKMSFDNGVKWNQTADLTIPTDENNYFKCTEGWWDAHNGAWTKYTLPL